MEKFLEEVEKVWEEEGGRERISHDGAPMCWVRYEVSSVVTENLGFPDSVFVNCGN